MQFYLAGLNYAAVVQLVERVPYMYVVGGSSPSSRIKLRRCGVVAARQSSKLSTGVRFSSPALNNWDVV